MNRENVCLGCHREIPGKLLAVSLERHATTVTKWKPVTNQQHESLLNKAIKGNGAARK